MLSREGGSQEEPFSQVRGSRQRCRGASPCSQGWGWCLEGSPCTSEPARRAGDLPARIRGHGYTLSGHSALCGCPSASPTAWGQEWVAVPGLSWGSLAQGWHLQPGHRKHSEATACPSCFSQKPGDIAEGLPHPLCTLVTLSASPWIPRSLARAGGWWVLSGMGAKPVLLLVGAGVGGLGAGECWDPFARGMRDREGGSTPSRAALW